MEAFRIFRDSRLYLLLLLRQTSLLLWIFLSFNYYHHVERSTLYRSGKWRCAFFTCGLIDRFSWRVHLLHCYPY